MVLSDEADSNEVRTNVRAGRQIGVKHGAYRRKKVPNDDVVFTGGGADTNVTAAAQDAPAFLRYGNRVRKMMKPASWGRRDNDARTPGSGSLRRDRARRRPAKRDRGRDRQATDAGGRKGGRTGAGGTWRR